ncbi:SMI1/KNR4 family protein [Bacillus spizizenii]|nr:SMI1/KNR4 family protein [Bacillus spizizenii]
MSHFVDKTITGLTNLLDPNGHIKLFCREGEISEFAVTLSDKGVTEADIQVFENSNGIQLPTDYREFLKACNGARIFETLFNGQRVGGGLHLFSLSELQENLSYLDLFEGVNGIAIAHLLEECHLVIDHERLKQNDPNYLFIFEDGLDYRPLHLNFEIFLDRYIMSQGETFWEWGHWTAANYYKTR